MPAHIPGLLFIVNSLGMGGAEKHVVTLLNHLDKDRFRLHLAYLKRSEQLLPQLHTEKLDALLCCDVKRSLELHAVRRLRRLIAEHDIDVVVCTNTYSMLYGYLARGRGRSAPRLATVFHTTLLQTRKEKAQMLLYRQLFKSCDLLLYVCENQRRYWREHGLRGVRDAVVYNGIDAAYFQGQQSSAEKLRTRAEFGFSAEDYVIGLCAGLRAEKAHGDLLRAVAALRGRGIPAKALLVGDGPERPSIEREAVRLGVDAHIRITGLKEDVRSYIACCDVMTLVSRTETFSLAALESMALGKPLVMSAVGGASEQVVNGESGLLFTSGDVEGLVSQLASLTSEVVRTRMGAAAAQRVQQLFTVDSMAAGFTEQMLPLAHSSGSELRVTDGCDAR
jgi:glycosyltransferase involved in cell wall biosynthesis